MQVTAGKRKEGMSEIRLVYSFCNGCDILDKKETEKNVLRGRINSTNPLV